MKNNATTLTPPTGFRRSIREHSTLGQRHRDRVHDQYVKLHATFERYQPSVAFRQIFERAVMSEILRRLDRGAPRVRILDVGCGVGIWADTIFSRLDPSETRVEYLGIDFVQPNVDSCNERLADRPTARAITGDFDTLRPELSYDLVMFIEAFCHLRRGQDDAWLQRAAQWLAPGGVIAVVDKERFSRHGWRLRWDCLKRAVLPAPLRGRPYYFPENYDALLKTFRYPSFSHLSRSLRRIGLTPRPFITHGLFTAVLADAADIRLEHAHSKGR